MWRYQLLLAILFPVLVTYTCWTGLKYRNFTFVKQRLGFGYPEFSSPPLWLHAASVGEVMAAKPILEKLISTGITNKILLTTTTPTGGEIAKKFSSEHITFSFLPIDWPKTVQLFLKTVNPKAALILETEIWPNLFKLSGNNGIPIITVNGRLSGRTLHAGNWIRSLYKSALQHTTGILTRSDMDSKNFVSLGADPDKVKTIGNIKFSIQTPSNLATSSHPCNNRSYILFASTHDNEEYIASKIWHDGYNKDQLLVIVPRHPVRLAEILKRIETLNLKIAIRSKKEPVTNETDIYIADTIGELNVFMHFAKIVFMGGSLVTVGGHNILEPASLGKPIVFGPHMENFEDEKQLFLQADAAIQVVDVDQLAETLSRLVVDNARLQVLGNNAKALIDRHAGIVDDYIREIASIVK